jgi:hypothetical protein
MTLEGTNTWLLRAAGEAACVVVDPGPDDATHLAAVAAAGLTELRVRRRPVVAVLPTGDELKPIGEPTGPGEILDTNSLMLAAQAREAGCDARRLEIFPDGLDRPFLILGFAVGKVGLEPFQPLVPQVVGVPRRLLPASVEGQQLTGELTEARAGAAL